MKITNINYRCANIENYLTRKKLWKKKYEKRKKKTKKKLLINIFVKLSIRHFNNRRYLKLKWQKDSRRRFVWMLKLNIYFVIRKMMLTTCFRFWNIAISNLLLKCHDLRFEFDQISFHICYSTRIFIIQHVHFHYSTNTSRYHEFRCYTLHVTIVTSHRDNELALTYFVITFCIIK